MAIRAHTRHQIHSNLKRTPCCTHARPHASTHARTQHAHTRARSHHARSAALAANADGALARTHGMFAHTPRRAHTLACKHNTSALAPLHAHTLAGCGRAHTRTHTFLSTLTARLHARLAWPACTAPLHPAHILACGCAHTRTHTLLSTHIAHSHEVLLRTHSAALAANADGALARTHGMFAHTPRRAHTLACKHNTSAPAPLHAHTLAGCGRAHTRTHTFLSTLTARLLARLAWPACTAPLHLHTFWPVVAPIRAHTRY